MPKLAMLFNIILVYYYIVTCNAIKQTAERSQACGSLSI